MNGVVVVLDGGVLNGVVVLLDGVVLMLNGGVLMLHGVMLMLNGVVLMLNGGVLMPHGCSQVLTHSAWVTSSSTRRLKRSSRVCLRRKTLRR